MKNSVGLICCLMLVSGCLFGLSYDSPDWTMVFATADGKVTREVSLQEISGLSFQEVNTVGQRIREPYYKSVTISFKNGRRPVELLISSCERISFRIAGMNTSGTPSSQAGVKVNNPGKPTPPEATNDGGRGYTGPQIEARMHELLNHLSTERYASLYADLSILIASTGTAEAGWKNGMDGSAPLQDAGRGLLNRNVHYTHCLGPGKATVHKLVGVRLGTLQNVLSAPSYARLCTSLSARLNRESN